MAEARASGSPCAVSADGSYFVDRAGAPAYWLGDTQWELLRALSLEEAKVVLANRKDKGFNAILVMLLGVGAAGEGDGSCDGRHPNASGERPWLDDNPLTPNEGYFRNVDAVVSCAAELGIALVLGLYHGRAGRENPIQLANAGAWACWVGERYRDAPNVIWSMYPAADPSSLPIARALARGVKEGDRGRHIVTVHPDPSPASSSAVFHGEEWLAFNTIQTYRFVELIVPMVGADRALAPRKPVVMAEGAYEEGIEYGFPVTPLWVRRQAYYSCLAGGYHCYGHNDSWRVLPTWKRALDAPGAAQMTVLKKVLSARSEWWELVPDPSIVGGGSPPRGAMPILAARHPCWRWVVVYLPDKGECSVRLHGIRAQGRLGAIYIDPRSGEEEAVSLPGRGSTFCFATPAGWEDALLVLEAH